MRRMPARVAPQSALRSFVVDRREECPNASRNSYARHRGCAEEQIANRSPILKAKTSAIGVTIMDHRTARVAPAQLDASAATPREAELRQGDVVVQLLEDHFHPPPDLGLGVLRFQQIAGEQRAGRVVEFDDDAGVGHRGGEALVAGMIHDRVGVDRSGAADAIMAHRFELQIRRDASGAGRIGRMLEMSAALAALQFQHAAPGRIPEWLRPFVRHRDRPGHFAPVTHGVRLISVMSNIRSPPPRRAVRLRCASGPAIRSIPTHCPRHSMARRGWSGRRYRRGWR